MFTIAFETLGRILIMVLGTPEEEISRTQALVAGLIIHGVLLLIITVVANLDRITS